MVTSTATKARKTATAKTQSRAPATRRKTKTDTTLAAQPATLKQVTSQSRKKVSAAVHLTRDASLRLIDSQRAIWLAGFSTYTKGLAALRQGRLNINALMTVAVTGAFLIGQWPEAAMVMVLFTVAELIEAKSLDRARNAVIALRDV